MARYGIGDTVGFTARGRTVQGVVKKVNPKNTQVRTPTGKIWNVPHALLHDADSPVEAPTVPEPTRPDFEIGQQVAFGRPNGQQRRGHIIKINPKNTQVRISTGDIWVVPHALLHDADGTVQAPTLPDFEIGQQVIFGRPNGQQRRGEIIKINPKNTKVRTPTGDVWNVPHALLRDADGTVEAPTRSEPTLPDFEEVRISTDDVWNVPNSLLRDIYGTVEAPTRPDFEIGQQVVFGRPNGQQRRGEIVKINLKSVGIKTDNGKRWRVAPALVHDAGAL